MTSGALCNQQRLEILSNNLANINTAGYKASSVIFSDVLSQTLRGASAPTDNLGGTNPKQIGLANEVMGPSDADVEKAKRILEAMDQPSIDGVNTWFVSKAAREAGLKVALSGLGGISRYDG